MSGCHEKRDRLFVCSHRCQVQVVKIIVIQENSRSILLPDIPGPMLTITAYPLGFGSLCIRILPAIPTLALEQFPKFLKASLEYCILASER